MYPRACDSTRSNGLGSGYGRAACVLKGWFWCALASYLMIVRGWIELRLDSALNPGDPADEMTAKALEDTTRADNIGREGYEKVLRDYQTRRARE